MNSKNFKIYFDCGSSKVRASAYHKDNHKISFFTESDFFFDSLNLNVEIQKIISFLEINTNEYLDDINLMIDTPDMLSINISISKKLNGNNLKKNDIQFLIMDAKQQVMRNHSNLFINHIIVKNYKINDTDYTFLPENINCDLISLDILFICTPKKIIEYYKKIFSSLDISINQIYSSSYAKSISYKENFTTTKNMSFVDMGFNKTSITCYHNNEIVFLDVLPIGGNHITKDISKILKIDLKEAEYFKLFFDKDQFIFDDKKISIDLIQNIIFSRIEEILELCANSIKLNLNLKTLKHSKMILMGEGSKILDNKFKEKISFANEIDLLEETLEDICKSSLIISEKFNKQEVVVIPKKQIKQGFFEKLFHFFR